MCFYLFNFVFIGLYAHLFVVAFTCLSIRLPVHISIHIFPLQFACLLFLDTHTRLRSLYSMNKMAAPNKSTRYISTSAEKVLDAPDVINDFCKAIS